MFSIPYISETRSPESHRTSCREYLLQCPQQVRCEHSDWGSFHRWFVMCVATRCTLGTTSKAWRHSSTVLCCMCCIGIQWLVHFFGDRSYKIAASVVIRQRIVRNIASAPINSDPFDSARTVPLRRKNSDSPLFIYTLPFTWCIWASQR